MTRHLLISLAVLSLGSLANANDNKCLNCQKLNGLPANGSTNDISKINDKLNPKVPELDKAGIEYATEMLCYGATGPGLIAEQENLVPPPTYFDEELLIQSGFGTWDEENEERINPFNSTTDYKANVQEFWNKYYGKIICPKDMGTTVPEAGMLAQLIWMDFEKAIKDTVIYYELDINVKDYDGRTIIDWIDMKLEDHRKNDTLIKVHVERLTMWRAKLIKIGAKTSLELEQESNSASKNQ